jgi:hypothetical protein
LKHDVVTVHVYSNNDNSWNVQHESGFGCHQFKSFSCVSCPENSEGRNLQNGCKCKKDFTGKITAHTDGYYFNGGYDGACYNNKAKCGDNVGFNANIYGGKTTVLIGAKFTVIKQKATANFIMPATSFLRPPDDSWRL